MHKKEKLRFNIVSEIRCPNWDSFHSQPLTVKATGRDLGVLMPRATQEALGYGIQAHSRPQVETRTD